MTALKKWAFVLMLNLWLWYLAFWVLCVLRNRR